MQAPLIALLGTAASLLSTAAAFGVARLVFQDGYGSGLLGFQPQGFLDAFLIRLVLLPVLLRLTGRTAWACPRWLRRVLPAIRFSH